MANYSLGKISKQPFSPTIFYDTLKAIIYTFHSTFLSEMVTVWKVATSIIKMILSAGCVQSNKNVVCSQSKTKLEVFTKITAWSCPGWARHQDICTGIMVDHYAQILKSFKFSWKRSTCYFLLESASLKQFLIDLSMQEKCLN